MENILAIYFLCMPNTSTLGKFSSKKAKKNELRYIHALFKKIYLKRMFIGALFGRMEKIQVSLQYRVD